MISSVKDRHTSGRLYTYTAKDLGVGATDWLFQLKHLKSIKIN
jgi:hypothetical protein